MTMRTLPPADELWRAFTARDPAYDGIFFAGVRTTGIFCRPTCPARKPLRENVEFFRTGREALFAGYRPCLRCRPLEPRGAAPAWLRPLLDEVDADPARRWRDADLRARGIEPERVRRWFKRHHGMTFHAYQRARRLGGALRHLSNGGPVTRTAFEHGWDSLSAFHEAVRRLTGRTPDRSRDTLVVLLSRVETPLGPMLAAASDDALRLLEFTDRRMLETQLERLQRRLSCVLVPGENEILRETERQLDAYFRGELRRFDLPLEPAGTDFQRSVWEGLRAIPYGTTRSYGEQARALGRPSAVRAVARGNGDNPIGIIVPCHRVVGADGSLTGYGGGLWRKKWLLDHERRHAGLAGLPLGETA